MRWAYPHTKISQIENLSVGVYFFIYFVKIYEYAKSKC